MIELDITVESAMTLLMSAGMVQPSNDQQKRLAAMAAAAQAAAPAGLARLNKPDGLVLLEQIEQQA